MTNGAPRMRQNKGCTRFETRGLARCARIIDSRPREPRRYAVILKACDEVFVEPRQQRQFRVLQRGCS